MKKREGILLIFLTGIMLCGISLFAGAVQGEDVWAKDGYSNEKVEKIISDEEILSDLNNYEDLSIEELQTLNNGEVPIYKDQETGMVRMIEGQFSNRVVKNTQDALMALLSVRSIMGIKEYSFTCMKVDGERNESCVYFLQQLYKEIPVDSGIFRVAVTKDGKTISVSGTYRDKIEVDQNPQMTSEEAEKILDLPSGSHINNVEPVIYGTQKDDYALAWKFDVSYREFFQETDRKEIYVDDVSGTVLSETSMINTGVY